jgi:hypothetical protein
MGLQSRPRGASRHEDLWCRRLVPERSVRPYCVVTAPPVLDYDLGLGEGVEDLPVE